MVASGDEIVGKMANETLFMGFEWLDKIKIRKGNPINARNWLNYFVLQLKDWMTEPSCWLEGGPMHIGGPITATWVVVLIITSISYGWGKKRRVRKRND